MSSSDLIIITLVIQNEKRRERIGIMTPWWIPSVLMEIRDVMFVLKCHHSKNRSQFKSNRIPKFGKPTPCQWEAYFFLLSTGTTITPKNHSHSKTTGKENNKNPQKKNRTKNNISRHLFLFLVSFTQLHIIFTIRYTIFKLLCILWIPSVPRTGFGTKYNTANSPNNKNLHDSKPHQDGQVLISSQSKGNSENLSVFPMSSELWSSIHLHRRPWFLPWYLKAKSKSVNNQSIWWGKSFDFCSKLIHWERRDFFFFFFSFPILGSVSDVGTHINTHEKDKFSNKKYGTYVQIVICLRPWA